MIERVEPKATADGIAVFCAHDKIVDTDELVGNPRNPNQHPKEQITALAKIIKRQGWRHPIVVSNRSGFVVKGHGRLLAAKELNAAQVPVDFQDYESEASEYADLMADNKIGTHIGFINHATMYFTGYAEFVTPKENIKA